MFLSGEGVDEILIALYKELLIEGDSCGGTRGNIHEKLGVSFRIDNSRARISRSQDRGKPFSALGELLWYLSGSNRLSFIEGYIPQYRQDAEEGILHGAYGPRIHNMRGSINQLNNVVALLRDNPSTKRAVIQLFDASDIVQRYKEIPCTTALQFLIRDNRLVIVVTMRSNDAYKGLPHDVFCFSMIQEMLAARLEVEVGEYLHFAASMHVYDDSTDAMKVYLNEGHQKTEVMPPMPVGDPFEVIDSLMAAEEAIREGRTISASEYVGDPYWADIIRLLQVYWATRRQNAPGFEELETIEKEFHADVYRSFLQRRRKQRVIRNKKSNNGEC
jgi:thymidylate synthase